MPKKQVNLQPKLNTHLSTACLFYLPFEVGKTREALEQRGYEFASAEPEFVPSTYVRLDDDNKMKMEKLLDMLEDNACSNLD